VIRFYSLNGFLNDGGGLTKSYDFGSDAAVKLRWRADSMIKAIMFGHPCSDAR